MKKSRFDRMVAFEKKNDIRQQISKLEISIEVTREKANEWISKGREKVAQLYLNDIQDLESRIEILKRDLKKI